MLIPKKDAKQYGAVHIDNYLTFIGFCKNIDNSNNCKVDIYINGDIINTIDANKSIKRIEDIYDIKGNCFEFELDDKYYDGSNILEVKSHNTKELMLNSPIKLINRNTNVK